MENTTENYAIEILRYEMYRVRMDIRISGRNSREAMMPVGTLVQMKELERQERELREAIEKLSS